MITLVVDLLSKLYNPIKDAITSAKASADRRRLLNACRTIVALFLAINKVYLTANKISEGILDILSFYDTGKPSPSAEVLGSMAPDYMRFYDAISSQLKNVKAALDCLAHTEILLTVLDHRVSNELSFWLDRKYGVIGQLEDLLRSGYPFNVEVTLVDPDKLMDSPNQLTSRQRLSLGDRVIIKEGGVVIPGEGRRSDDPSVKEGIDEYGRARIMDRHYITRENHDDTPYPDEVVDFLRTLAVSGATTKSLEELKALLERYDTLIKSQFKVGDLVDMLREYDMLGG